MSTTVTFLCPPEYNLEAFANSTTQSLRILRPWARDITEPYEDNLLIMLLANPPLIRKNSIEEALSKQADQYVRAIQLGTSAAHKGYLVIQGVLFLVDTLAIADKNELKVYLENLMQNVDQARKECEVAQRAFKDVRVDIFKV